ncbi:hypothetical protein D7B24_008415 [Verticillium nonalfalfae]|uniref:Uncharacterized protein n=1 Tax=Verticillium nonalfalfae TaxID=1051616 RepID=A0A3M9Y5K3_9PEZI|nr:uncharacterized protein D7B24_008415 [Verticillium nonalfalfae]RNJ55551.1 hypothetical protein D7B24_008415 [Verticillium nonalfalfae]
MPEFRFIASDTSGGKLQPADKEARSHAIKQGLQRGAQARSETDKTSRQAQDATSRRADLRGRFRLAGAQSGAEALRKAGTRAYQQPDWTAWFKNDRAKSSNASRGQTTPFKSVPRLKAHVMDPFNSLPIPSSPTIDSLAKYFVNGFSLNLTTVDKQRPWFPYAMQSELVMRATLALAAGFWTASLPSLDARLQIEGYRQKGEAMRAISSRLQTTASSRVASRDTSVLAAVATLANVEESGGPDTIRHDYILCRCINWVDVQVASGLGRIPFFPTFHTLDQVVLPAHILHQAVVPPLSDLGIEEANGSATAACVHTILTLLRQAICAQTSDSVGADGIRILMGTADSCILNFLYGGAAGAADYRLSSSSAASYAAPSSSAAHAADKRVRALVLGAHIFLYVALRDVPPTSQLLTILCCRLRALLTELDEPPAAGVGRGALSLWLAFVGLVGSGGGHGAAAGSENAQWFAAMFQTALRDTTPGGTLTEAGRRDLRTTLRSFLWEERHCRAVLDTLERRHSVSPPPDVEDVGVEIVGGGDE